MATTMRAFMPHCPFRIGQRVRMRPELQGDDGPEFATITGIEWRPEQPDSLNIWLITDKAVAEGRAPTGGWSAQRLRPIAPNDPSGIEIDLLGGNCPVQAEGRADGVEFYFRARGSRWSISIGSACPIDHPLWYWEESYGAGPYDAGWMDEEEAIGFIAEAVARWRRGEAPRAQGSARAASEATADAEG